MKMPFSPMEIVWGAVGLGLVARGLMQEVAKQKSPPSRDDLMEIRDMLRNVLGQLDNHDKKSERVRDDLIRILAILEERK